MGRRPRVAALGGTFDRLHAGHRFLLAAAFAAADRVAVGVTTDAYLADHPKAHGATIAPFAVRRRRIAQFLRAEYPRRTWSVVPLADGFGRSVEPGIDVLVVSAETEAGAHRVNRERRRRRLPAVRLVVVPQLLADDLRPLSATRIRAGDVTRTGRIRRPVRVTIDPRLPRELAREIPAVVRRLWPAGGRGLRFDRTAGPTAARGPGSQGRRPAYTVRAVRPRGTGRSGPWIQLEGEDGAIGAAFAPVPAGTMAAGLARALASRRARWVGDLPPPRRRRAP